MDDIAPEDIIGEEDVGNVRKYMKGIYSEVRSIATEAKFANFRQHGHNEAIKSNSNYNFYMIVGESILFILICGVQVYYIKKFLESKRVI